MPLNVVDDISNQLKLEAFRQHWEQLRHIEGVRLAFTGFYAAIVTGVISLATRAPIVVDSRWLFLILLVLSVMGVFISLRTLFAIEQHRDDALWFAKMLAVGDEFERYIPYSDRKFWVNGKCRCFYVVVSKMKNRWLYVGIYAAASIVFLLLTICPNILK